MPGHVEGDDAAPGCDIRIVQHMAKLAAVGTGCVQADQRYALTSFFVKDAESDAVAGDVDVAADNVFVSGTRPRLRLAPSA